ncbi:ABC transporter substrate-binding protein [Roseomonas sp. NAR14]|uniref:ABC transporter substrate-binding protein n=1 Tax=Roseomonas acroporae TaxID=2937791 RepID=A0A9X2BUY0_9PROT|nr:ABC transporter substrate-binding protein [Roseomonas acroporae]MCK8783434.1 ABC transporter substrate-binding protein [Roseomonas acroporae]
MQRRHLLLGSTATLASPLAAPRLARAQGGSQGSGAAGTLRFVPYADLALIDPIVTSAYVTRTHALMVFDTLYGLDENGAPRPQMVEGHRVEDDGKRWTLTLREGLRFHDGTPVLARDVVASLERWAKRDPFGDALMAATDELAAPDDRTIRFRLKRAFPLLPNALGKPTSYLPVIMPERLARTEPTRQVPELVGSGPFRFVAGERVPGARAVYARFEGYVPRPDGTPSFTAGPRLARFERVEWQTIPDAATAAGALRNGEVDWVEQPSIDLLPLLRRDRNIVVRPVETNGLIGVLRFNHLQPPFNRPEIRRVVLKAVRQADFMEAVAGADRSIWRDNVGVFTPGSPMASDAGMSVLSGKHDPAALKRELAAAGYNGERTVLLAGTDVPRINAVCEVAGEMLRQLGFNLDYVATDWGTVVQRNANRQPVDQGGWSLFATYWGGLDFSSPAGHQALRGNGLRAWNGWPTSPRIEALRDQWFTAPDLATQQRLAREMQLAVFEEVPYVPVGQFTQPTAYRRDLTGVLTGLPLLTNVARG